MRAQTAYRLRLPLEKQRVVVLDGYIRSKKYETSGKYDSFGELWDKGILTPIYQPVSCQHHPHSLSGKSVSFGTRRLELSGVSDS